MYYVCMCKVTYEGLQRYRNVDSGIDETLIDRRKPKSVPKEESSIYLERLVPQSVYVFNITASFLDGSTGPVTSIHVETSAEGCRQPSITRKSRSSHLDAAFSPTGLYFSWHVNDDDDDDDDISAVDGWSA